MAGICIILKFSLFTFSTGNEIKRKKYKRYLINGQPFRGGGR